MGYYNTNHKAIPIRVNLKNKDDTIKQEVNDYIGPYGTPNTYTANLPEFVRKDYIVPDSSQRIAYKNPNHSYV